MSEAKKQKKIEDLTLGEVKQMCKNKDMCCKCIFVRSCHRLFKGVPSQWLESDLNEKIREGKE